jgi:glycosyltransferase involved in cell wall biosynthesis
MKLLFCCENYPPSIGGVQEVIRQIAERLVLSGFEVTVATSAHPNRDADVLMKGVRVLSFPVSGNFIHGMRGELSSYRRLLLEGNFDVIMIKAAQQWTFDAAIDVLPSLNCRKFLIPCGFSGLNKKLYRKYFQLMPRWLAYFDGLIFYSHEYQDTLFARQHGLKNLYFLSNGVDEQEFLDLDSHNIRKKLGIPQGHDILLSVGSLIAEKGHWEVVRAFANAKINRATTLVINGNSPKGGMFSKAKRMIKNLTTGRFPLEIELCLRGLSSKSEDKSVLIVDLKRIDLVNLYKASNLFIFASHVEYSPLVLFEAAAAGVPFISSAAGNSAEIADWTGAGKIIPPMTNKNAEVSIDVLTGYIEDNLENRNQLQYKGECGRSAIFSKGFTWAEITKLYQSLLCGTQT